MCKSSTLKGVVVMKFTFMADVESPSAGGVLHFQSKEIGGDVQFTPNGVRTEYFGSTEDEKFKQLIALYEAKPHHLVTVSTY